MPSHSSNDAPSTLASIQAFVSRAGFFWRGGAISLVVVFGASLIVAFVLGDTYESESIVEFAESAAERSSEARSETPEQQLRGALMDRGLIEQLTRELAGEPLEGAALKNGIEATAKAIRVGPRGDRRFAIAFRAPNAATAQRGSDSLAQAAMNAIEARGEPQSEEALKRVKALEERTKELAGFVAEHPEVALTPPQIAPATSAHGASSSAAPADSALVVLQQQRGRLEWRIAEAEKREASGGGNPYDNATDRASLQRMLAQVKAAIAARQAVSLRAGAEASASGRLPSPPPKSAAAVALHAEWQRLVERVVEAQLQAPSKREGIAQGGLLRIVQRASLPVRPLKPDKRLIALLGMAGGVWAGIIWAFARVALGHDLGESWGDEPEAEGDFEVSGEEDPAGQAEWTEANALEATALPPAEGGPASGGSPVTARDGGGWQLLGAAGAAGAGARGKPGRFPKDLLATAPGVVDVSRVLAQTGVVPNRIPPVQVVPILELGPRGEPLPPQNQPPADPNAGVYAYHRQEPGAQPPPAAAPPAAPQASAPVNRPTAPNPQGAPIRTTGVTQTFASPTAPSFWQPSPAPAAVPMPAPAPAPTPAPPPAAAPPGGETFRPNPSPAGGSQPPTYGLALRSKPPEDVISLRDVPLGWSPHPSMMQTGSMNELLTLRDQLYRLAVNGCFVVGVTSGPDGTGDKSCIAAQLASLVAGPGRARVLLVEANFDRPAVHRLMRIDMPFSQGFSEQMRRRMTASRKPWVLFRCAANLHVLAEGLVRSPGLLSSVQFGEAIAELRGYYDIIVADGPIAESTIDTVAFDALMDGIVLVGAVGSSPSKLLEEASKWFAHKQLMAVISADASAEERIEFGPQSK